MSVWRLFGWVAVLATGSFVIALIVGAAIDRMGKPDPHEDTWRDLLEQYGYREEDET